LKDESSKDIDQTSIPDRVITPESKGISRELNPNMVYKMLRIESERRFIIKNAHKFNCLTHREKEVLSCILEGYSNPEIADRLYISRNTVEQHRKNIKRKLKVSNMAELFKFGYAFNLV